MPLSIAQIVFDCQEPEKLAGFWAEVVGRPVDPGASPFFATVGRFDGSGLPALMFLKVPEPRTVKNRVHLDLTSTGWAAELERLTDLGAVRVAEFREYGTHWVTLRDPEGNEFDVGAGLEDEEGGTAG